MIYFIIASETNIMFYQINALSPQRKTFFASYVKPHQSITAKTLSRWVLDLLDKSGVDTATYKSHSTRAAASTMFHKSLSAIEICQKADWSQTSGVYQKFYQRFL